VFIIFPYFQTIELMQHLGCSVSTTSLNKKRKKIAEEHKGQVQDLVMSRREAIEVYWADRAHSILRCNRCGIVMQGQALKGVYEQTLPYSPLEMYTYDTVSGAILCCSAGQSSNARSFLTPWLCSEFHDCLPIYTTNWYGVLHPPTSGMSGTDLSDFTPSPLSHCDYDIVSDNCDITVNPTYMTVEKQRKSYHWFLNLAIKKRVTDPTLPSDRPKANLRMVDNTDFLPSVEQCAGLDESFSHHIAKILVDFSFLDQFRDSIPDYISHPYLEEMSKRSEFVILDLLDKSENKSDDMIDIVQWIHENFIPHTPTKPPEVIEKVVLGGDVLTNERAYSAQKNMMNGETAFEKLGGIVHRPEGLHRLMNLTLVGQAISDLTFNCSHTFLKKI
jgi:hypothetical protein